MSNYNHRNILQRLQRSNIKAFMFFLLMSIVVWVLVQFARDYSKEIVFKVNYTNVPKDKLILKDKQTLTVEINSSGFKILGLELLTPALELNLATLDTVGGRFVLDLDKNRNDITRSLKIPERTSRFLQDTISIAYEQKTVKKVPVTASFTINYAAGFSNVDSLKVTPDSITISGPKNILDTITTLRVTSIDLKQVKQSIFGEASIDTLNYENVTFYSTTLTYSQKVDKFTEGKITVPITLINVPSNVKVTIFPREIAIIYQASLHNFGDIEANDFKVTEDFNELNRSMDYFIPRITKKPAEAMQARLSSSKIQYIIKQ